MEVECHKADVIAHSWELQVLASDTRQSVITRESLAQKWFVGLEAAGRTLNVTWFVGGLFGRLIGSVSLSPPRGSKREEETFSSGAACTERSLRCRK
jgi:hypothetical protein